jgi:hypothetical protein
MNTAMVVGLLVIVVVGFFAYQWWAGSTRRRQVAGMANRKDTILSGAVSSPMGVASPSVQPAAPAAAPVTTALPVEEKMPVVAGQTEAELRAKEPIQRPDTATVDEPIGHEDHAPAKFHSNLRHPEQLFHQPTAPVPTMTDAEVMSGRAATKSTPLDGHQQPFSPEMAQNGGAMVGESVFAFDGMEPTGFASF